MRGGWHPASSRRSRRTMPAPTRAGGCRCTAASPASRRCGICRSSPASAGSRATSSAPHWACRRIGRWCWCRSAATAPAASTCTPPPPRCAAWPTWWRPRTTRSRPATASTASTKRRCTGSGSATRTWSARSTWSPPSRATGSSRIAPRTPPRCSTRTAAASASTTCWCGRCRAIVEAAFIGQEDLLAGRWRDAVAELLARPPRAAVPADGAMTAADWLSEILDSSGAR